MRISSKMRRCSYLESVPVYDFKVWYGWLVASAKIALRSVSRQKTLLRGPGIPVNTASRRTLCCTVGLAEARLPLFSHRLPKTSDCPYRDVTCCKQIRIVPPHGHQPVRPTARASAYPIGAGAARHLTNADWFDPRKTRQWRSGILAAWCAKSRRNKTSTPSLYIDGSRPRRPS